MASQPSFILNPSYSGPMVVAETLRKMKSDSGLNRMLTAYNKRCFVLDLNHTTFYYLPDRESHFSSATNISLPSITGIRVIKHIEDFEEDKIWKHKFVIDTKKKNLELIADSKASMDRILFAFSNLINTKTNRPLFNWDQYTGSPKSQTFSLSNLAVAKSPDTSPKEQKEEPVKSPENSIDSETLQPDQRGELDAELMKIERPNKEEMTSQSSDRESYGSDDQKENKQTQEEGQKKPASMQYRRKATGFAVSRGKGFEVAEKEASPVKKEEMEPAQEEAEVKKSLSPMKRREKIQIKLEMLSSDQIEADTEKTQQQKFSDSNREFNNKNHNAVELSLRRGSSRLLVNLKSSSVKNMVRTEADYMSCNEADLSHKRSRMSKHSEGNSFQSLGSARSSANDEKPIGFGTGATQQVSKFSLYKPEKNNENDENAVNVNVESVKKSAENDDDWDNEMFGYGKHQLSPLKPKNHEQKLSKTVFSDKKSQLSQKRSEFVATRQTVHNDWDDEL